MKEFTSQCQASFVSSCQGLDNMAIYQEFVHTMRYTKAKKGAIVIKMDLEKAYDRLEWGFIVQTLEDAWVPDKLSAVIMQLISKEPRRLFWNGDATDTIKPSRDLRQGSPLSPIFLCYA